MVLIPSRRTAWNSATGVLLEEVVFDGPDVVDAELVGQHHLFDGIGQQLLFIAVDPWPWKLVFVEDPESHVVLLGCSRAQARWTLETEQAVPTAIRPGILPR